MFECIFDKHSKNIYRAGKVLQLMRQYDNAIHAYFIRKHNLKRILEKAARPTAEIPAGFKQRMLLNYLTRIVIPIEQNILQVKFIR